MPPDVDDGILCQQGICPHRSVALGIIYASIAVWCILFLLAVRVILRIRLPSGHDLALPRRQIEEANSQTEPSQASGSGGKLETVAVHCWHWRGQIVHQRKTARIRGTACAVFFAMTLVTICWRVLRLGLVKGIAEQFSYLTQWGIMLSNAYFFLAWLVFRQGNQAYDGRQASPSSLHWVPEVSKPTLSILELLQTLALCFEVMIFVMWLVVAIDANVHQHVLAPAMMVVEVALNRIPIPLANFPWFLLAMLVYIAVNFATTRCWFVVYKGVITYQSSQTFIWLSIAVAVGCITFFGASILRSRQLISYNPGEIDANGRELPSRAEWCDGCSLYGAA